MTKVRVQIKYCCCCSLTVTTILIAVYTILMFLILTGLAIWGVTSDETQGRYKECEADAKNEDCSFVAKTEVTITNSNAVGVLTTGGPQVVICDYDGYHCSLGLYTEELKYNEGSRSPVLIFNIVLFLLLIIAAIMILIGLLINLEWLLLPWIALMVLEVLRGFISCIMIFVNSHSALSRIAVGIFFLGVQLFHISIILIAIAKFQRMHDKKKGVDYKIEKQPDKVLADGSMVYPTLPSHYAYSNSPHARREGYYQTNNYNTYAGQERQVYRAPSLDPAAQYGDPRYGPQAYPPRQQYQRNDSGRTM